MVTAIAFQFQQRSIRVRMDLFGTTNRLPTIVQRARYKRIMWHMYRIRGQVSDWHNQSNGPSPLSGSTPSEYWCDVKRFQCQLFPLMYPFTLPKQRTQSCTLPVIIIVDLVAMDFKITIVYPWGFIRVHHRRTLWDLDFTVSNLIAVFCATLR